MHVVRIVSGTPCASARTLVQKRLRIGAPLWRTFNVPHTIQSREYSMGSGMDGAAHKLWAVNANWNGDGWNVNANSIENPNRWNVGNEFVSRYSFLSPPTGGVFARMPFRQPPIILPISSIRMASSSQCLFEISFASQEICTKNRIESMALSARANTVDFSPACA